MEELDLELILGILKEAYGNWYSEITPCTRIKKQIEILKKLLTNDK